MITTIEIEKDPHSFGTLARMIMGDGSVIQSRGDTHGMALARLGFAIDDSGEPVPLNPGCLTGPPFPDYLTIPVRSLHAFANELVRVAVEHSRRPDLNARLREVVDQLIAIHEKPKG